MSGAITAQRISAKEVCDALHDTGLKPADGVWVSRSEGIACGLGAVMLARELEMPEYPNSSKIARLLGLTYDYAAGFIDGWDDMLIFHNANPKIELPEGDFRLGYYDGREAARACGLPEPDGEEGTCLGR